MTRPFLSFVEGYWDQLRGAPGFAAHRCTSSTSIPDRLMISVESANASASIEATETLRTLTVTVRRFKDVRVLGDGPCSTHDEAEKRLRALAIDLNSTEG